MDRPFAAVPSVIVLLLAPLLNACSAHVAPPPPPGTIQLYQFRTVPHWLVCTPVNGPPRSVKASVGPQGGAVRFDQPGSSRREHVLLVHPGLQGTHTFTMTEKAGNRLEVEITADPAITATSGFSAILILDATACPNLPPQFLIARNVDGVAQGMLSGYSVPAKLAWAYLNSLSSYAIAAP